MTGIRRREVGQSVLGGKKDELKVLRRRIGEHLSRGRKKPKRQENVVGRSP